MVNNIESVIDQAYKAFNSRDINAVFKFMSPDVHWPNGWEGGFVEGHDGVMSYWRRQWKEIDPYVQPVSIRVRPDEKVEVLVRQTVKDLEGKILFDGMVKHIYNIKEGLIKSMEIEK